MNLTELAQTIHKDNQAKGFWPKGRNLSEVLMLIVSECSEWLEAMRKGEEKSPCDKNIVVAFDGFTLTSDVYDLKRKHPEYFLSNEAEEAADIIIRTLDLCGHLGIDIDRAVYAKLGYNKLRPQKHGKKF